MKKKLFKTKKVFLLSLVIPVLIFFFAFLSYKKNPVICGNSFTIVTKCENFLEYLNSVEGFIWAGLAILSLVISLLVIFSLFFIINGKKKTGYTFLVLLILLLFFILLKFFLF